MSEEGLQPIHIAIIGGEYTFIPPNDVIKNVQQSLTSVPNEKSSENSYNIRSAQLQSIFDTFYTSTLSNYSSKIQMYFAYQFLSLKTIEEKKIGTLIITKILDELTTEYINDFERIFDNDITSWEICDAFSIKVLGPLIKKSDDFAHKIAEWKDSGKLWRMRSSCVTFVCLAKVGAMPELCFEVCSSCVRSSERFVQLGVGCLLREMSLLFNNDVIKFITENYRYFSREGLRYSIDKLDNVTRKRILTMGKNRKSKNKNENNQTNQNNENSLVNCVKSDQIMNSMINTNNVDLRNVEDFNFNPMYMIGYFNGDNGIFDMNINEKSIHHTTQPPPPNN